MLQVTQKIFTNYIAVTMGSWFYEGTECDDNDLDDADHWGPYVVPSGQQRIFSVRLRNEDDWEPDWSYANFNFTVQNNPDLFSNIIDLQLSKDDGGTTAYPRDTIVYTLTYANLSEQDATGVRIVETVPDYTTFDAAASSPGWDCQPDGNPGSLCTMDVGRVSSASSYEPLTFAVRVDNLPPAGVDQIDNTAYILDDGAYGADISPQNNFASDMTPVNPAVVSITRADTNPTSAYSVNFAVTFTKPVTAVDPADFSLTTTGLVGSAITAAIPITDGTVWTVTADTSSGLGSLRLVLIDSPTIQDTSANPLAGPYTSGETYTIDHVAPVMRPEGVIGFPGNQIIHDLESFIDRFTYFEIYFDEALSQDGFGNPDDEVTNPANYLLVDSGPDLAFSTSSCLVGREGDDILLPTGPVTYDPLRFMAKVDVNGSRPLSTGKYRLILCGTTSLIDLVGNPLNGGTDTIMNFQVYEAWIPPTGFPQGQVTELPAQPDEKTYNALADSGITLEIPTLGVRLPIVGVPLTENGWDVTWLGWEAGYLQGTAFPTRAGNTVITAHVWDAFNNPGPFAKLKNLKYGDRFFVHAWGLTYTYEVRENRLVRPTNILSLLKHEELDWVTLFTCEGYKDSQQAYSYRRVVRAVLINISSELKPGENPASK